MWAVRADGIGEPTLLQPLSRDVTSLRRVAGRGLDRLPHPALSIAGHLRGRDRDGPRDPPRGQPNFDEISPAISPDGRWIAYSSTETGAPQVYVRPFPNVEAGRWQISDGVGAAPIWARGGHEIFYATTTALYTARIETDPTIRVTGHSLLFNLPPGVTPVNARGWYDASTDDKSFLMARPAQFGTAPGESKIELIMVQNFFEELKARIRP